MITRTTTTTTTTVNPPPNNNPNLQQQPKKRGRKRKNISEEDRKEMVRMRNREHARVTRKRQKLKMAALHQQLAELQQGANGGGNDTAAIAAKLHGLQRETLKTFLELQSNVAQEPQPGDAAAWASVMEPSFKMSTPSMPYHQPATSGGRTPGVGRTFYGPKDNMNEFATAAAWAKSLSPSARLAYHVAEEDVCQQRNKLMAAWTLKTTGLEGGDVIAEGMIKCTFPDAMTAMSADVPTQKLCSVNVTFDVMNFTNQLRESIKRSSGGAAAGGVASELDATCESASLMAEQVAALQGGATSASVVNTEREL